MKVLKHSVPLDDQWHDIGNGLPVFVGEQPQVDINAAQVWTAQKDSDKGEPWKARVFGTGPAFDIPDDAIHLGSYQSAVRPLVWHVFALPA